MMDSDKTAYVLTTSDSNIICGKQHASISLIPMDKNVTGVSTQGLRYEIKNEPLYFGSTSSLSNEMLQDTATIYLRTGLLLVIIVSTNLISFSKP